MCDVVVCFKFLWGCSLLLGFECVGKGKGKGEGGGGRVGVEMGGGMGSTMGRGGGLCFALLHCWNRCVVNGIKDGDSTMGGMGCVWLRGWTMGLFLLRGIDTSGMSEEEDVLRSANRCRVWVGCIELGLVNV